MYNGIGLPTARGSGTNGYIQRNLANPRKKRVDIVSAPDPKLDKPVSRSILIHTEKRRIESDCVRLHKKLADKGYSDNEIELEVKEYRRHKLEKLQESEKKAKIRKQESLREKSPKPRETIDKSKDKKR